MKGFDLYLTLVRDDGKMLNVVIRDYEGSLQGAFDQLKTMLDEKKEGFIIGWNPDDFVEYSELESLEKALLNF